MIPEAAVEAAAKAIWGRVRVDSWEASSDDLNKEACLLDARLALEAAAPHMRAEVWGEGKRHLSQYAETTFWNDWERCPKRHGHAAHILDCAPPKGEQDHLRRIPTYAKCSTCDGGGCGDCL